MSSERQLALIWMGVVVALLAVSPWAALVAHHLPACPVKSVSGLPCPSCGSGRAMVALSRLDFGRALSMNPLAVVGTLVFGLGGLVAGARAAGDRPLWRVPRQLPPAIVALVAIGFAANWAYLVWRGI